MVLTLSRFDIDPMIGVIGENVTIQSISRAFNEEGDATDTPTNYTSKVIVEPVDFKDEIVESGIVQPGDIRIYVSADDANTAYWINDNEVTWNSDDYRIVEVLINNGHREVYAKRI